MTNKKTTTEINISSLKRQPVKTLLALAVETLRVQPSHNSLVQLVRSLVVSVIALIFDFGSLVLLKERLGINYLLAASIGFLVGVIVNYGFSVLWVFASRKQDSRTKEIAIFFVICGIGLLLNLLLIAVTVEILHFDYRLAKGFSTVVVFFWNFIARKKILY